MDGLGKTRDWGLRITLVVGVLLAAGGVAALVFLTGQPLPSYGPSMNPTLRNVDALDIDTHAFDGREPEVGDIVVAQAPDGVDSESCGVDHGYRQPCPMPSSRYSDIRVVKRIVGAPGDRIAFAPNGAVIRDGQLVTEAFIRRCRPRVCGLPRAITVPADHWFLAGDNRPVSSDSRAWGPVATAALDGLVRLPERND